MAQSSNSSTDHMSVGQSNALRMSSSGRSASRGTSVEGHRNGPESSTPETDRKFPFTIRGGSQENFGYHLGSQTRSRTKDEANRDATRSLEVEREDVDDAEATDRLSELPNDSLVQPNSVFKPSRTFPFLRYVLCWIIIVSLSGALMIFLIEKKRFMFFDCFFLAMATTTASGLTTINILSLSSFSLAVLATLALLGSSVMISLLPVVVRQHYLKQHIPKELHTFDVKNFQRLPLWVVEYKSLQFVVRLVMLYQFVFYIGGAFTIYLCVLGFGEEKVTKGGGFQSADPASFSIFTSIMAFTNAGIGLRPSFRGVAPFVLVIVNGLVMAGNTFFPILLRWTIIALNKYARDDSNRKIYFRYLLINGRNHYTHIFTSQQTWLLVSLQFFFLTFQSICLRWLGTNVNNNQAVFMSVNTRHAGFSSVDLGTQNAGVLVLFLAMMFLAPTPFMFVLKKSDDEAAISAKTNGRGSLKSIETLQSNGFSENRSSSLSSLSSILSATPSEGDESAGDKDGVELTTSGHGRVDPVGWRMRVSQGVRSMPGASLLRARVLTKANVETRMASRTLAMQLAASQAGGNSMGVLEVENRVAMDIPDDPYMDTRLVLLKKYGGGQVPTSVKIGYRLDALKKSLSNLLFESSRAGMSRDMAFIWFVWFLILCVEKYTPQDSIHSNIFNCIFEICSAFGNVGLSIGSNKVKDASFSADLHVFNQFVLLCVMVLGRTREFPSEIDGSLQLVSGDIISASFLKPGAVVRRKEAGASKPNTITEQVESAVGDDHHQQEEKSTSPSPVRGLEEALGNTDV